MVQIFLITLIHTRTEPWTVTKTFKTTVSTMVPVTEMIVFHHHHHHHHWLDKMLYQCLTIFTIYTMLNVEIDVVVDMFYIILPILNIQKVEMWIIDIRNGALLQSIK